jgi:hypothetical protein
VADREAGREVEGVDEGEPGRDDNRKAPREVGAKNPKSTERRRKDEEAEPEEGRRRSGEVRLDDAVSIVDRYLVAVGGTRVSKGTRRRRRMGKEETHE